MKYKSKYTYDITSIAPVHTWSVVGARGGIHLHITDYSASENKDLRDIGRSGGLECHWRNPPDYMKDQAPSHDHCWLLRQPCWHDGSSSVVSDFWIPFWLSAPHDHERMLRVLEGELDKLMPSEEEDL